MALISLLAFSLSLFSLPPSLSLSLSFSFSVTLTLGPPLVSLIHPPFMFPDRLFMQLIKSACVIVAALEARAELYHQTLAYNQQHQWWKWSRMSGREREHISFSRCQFCLHKIHF